MKNGEKGGLFIGVGLALAGVFAALLDFAERNPDSENQIFILGGVLIASAVNMMVAQIQIWANERREETLNERHQGELKRERERMAVEPRYKEVESNLRYLMEDIYTKSTVISYLFLYTRERELTSDQYLDVIKPISELREREARMVRSLVLPPKLSENKELARWWLRALELQSEKQELYMKIFSRGKRMNEEGVMLGKDVVTEEEFSEGKKIKADMLAVRGKIIDIIDGERVR